MSIEQKVTGVTLSEEYEYIPSDDPAVKHMVVNAANHAKLIKTVNNILTHQSTNNLYKPVDVAKIDEYLKGTLDSLVQLTTAMIANGQFKSDTQGIITAKMTGFGKQNARINKLLTTILKEQKDVSTEAFTNTEFAQIIAEPLEGEGETRVMTKDGGLMGFDKQLKRITAYITDQNGKIIDSISKQIDDAETWRQSAVLMIKRVFHILLIAVVRATLYVISRLYSGLNIASAYTDNVIDHATQKPVVPAVA
jgi:hypothetical protein